MPPELEHLDIDSSEMDHAIRNLRMLILAGEHYRQMVAESTGLGATESQALSYLEVRGAAGSPTWLATSA